MLCYVLIKCLFILFPRFLSVPTGPPRDLLVEPVSDGHIIISWSVPSYDKLNGRIVKYEVTYKSKTKKAKSLFTKQLQREIKGLERNQRYEITVRAFTRVGPGPYSKYTVYSTETGEFIILIVIKTHNITPRI